MLLPGRAATLTGPLSPAPIPLAWTLKTELQHNERVINVHARCQSDVLRVMGQHQMRTHTMFVQNGGISNTAGDLGNTRSLRDIEVACIWA